MGTSDPFAICLEITHEPRAKLNAATTREDECKRGVTTPDRFTLFVKDLKGTFPEQPRTSNALSGSRYFMHPKWSFNTSRLIITAPGRPIIGSEIRRLTRW
jgi:hypothetical protein